MEPIINIYSKEHYREWHSILNRMKSYDFYHTYSYHQIFETETCKPFLFYFKMDDVEIAFPMLLRKIDDYSNRYDITSSYGYSGPITSTNEINNAIIDRFHNELKHYFINHKVVSAFSRLHPSLKNENLIANLGEIVSLSETVFIDLKDNLENQRKQFKKGVKSDLSKLYKGNYEIFEDVEKNNISEFINIYNENMHRIKASSGYFFSSKYYHTLLNSEDINARLYFVIKDDIKIAGGIFVFTKNIIQYHLSATRNEYLKNSPIRLLIDYVRKLGTKNKYKELHLGGGVGSTEDSLFKFKAGFSNLRHQFKVWRYIVDNEQYDELVKLKGNIENKSYFPLYRSI